jgi:hypothetical protein
MVFEFRMVLNQLLMRQNLVHGSQARRQDGTQYCETFARNSLLQWFSNSAASLAVVFFWILSHRLKTICLICILSEIHSRCWDLCELLHMHNHISGHSIHIESVDQTIGQYVRGKKKKTYMISCKILCMFPTSAWMNVPLSPPFERPSSHGKNHELGDYVTDGIGKVQHHAGNWHPVIFCVKSLHGQWSVIILLAEYHRLKRSHTIVTVIVLICRVS